MRVLVHIEETTLTNERGYDQDGIEATCARCEHTVEVFGTEDASIKRACATLREECPFKEHNFYQPDE